MKNKQNRYGDGKAMKLLNEVIKRRLSMKRYILMAVCLMMAWGHCVAAERDLLEADPASLKKWQDMRFGMFICWGPVSLTGHEIGFSRGNPTPISVYDNLYKKFNPEKFNAEEWAKIVKQSGARYVIWLTKHLDGFCMWDTKLWEHNIMKTPLGRDVTREFADALKKEGIALVPYWCIGDYLHPDSPSTGKGGSRGKSKKKRQNADIERYADYLQAQSKELIDNYGPLLGMWYDAPHGFDDKIARRVIRYVRGLQPTLLINNRLCDNTIYKPGDYDTPEQRLGLFNRRRPWETCVTLGTQWSWKPNDELKSSTEAVSILVRCAVGDGNLALNTNPMPDGRIEPRQVDIFKKIGNWLEKYGESIYETRGGPYVSPAAVHVSPRGQKYHHLKDMTGSWGGSTHRGNTVYLHVLKWPEGDITLPDIGIKLKSHKVLTGGEAQIKEENGGFTVSVPEESRDAVDTIVKLEFDGAVDKVKPIILESK